MFLAKPIPASGTTFAELPASGASGHLARLIGQIAAVSGTPATPTISATGGGTTGGALTAGTYYLKIAETDGIGETGPSAEFSVTIAAGNIPQITFGALLTGSIARNVYVGVASGTETLYASGVETATCNLAAAQPTGTFAVAPPAVNTTGLQTRNLSSLRYCTRGRLQTAWDEFSRLYDAFARGDAIDYPSAVTLTRNAVLVFGSLETVALEFGALLDANPGHLATTTTGIGGLQTRRVWP